MKSRQSVNTILQGHVLDISKTFDDDSIDCIITSPPYYSLRSYATEPQIWGGDKDCNHDWSKVITPPRGGIAYTSKVGANRNAEANARDKDIVSDICTECGAWRGELGREVTPESFINNLCSIFDVLKDKLKEQGTCWVNLGDTYGGTGSKGDYKDPKYKDGRNGQSVSITVKQRNKSLLLIPERFVIEMFNRGWIVRQLLIWRKGNAMPSSVKDRFTQDFEQIFFFTKNKKYYFKQQFEPQNNWVNSGGHNKYALAGLANGLNKTKLNKKGRNMRAVWDINTTPSREKHYAAYPKKLVARMVDAGCPQGGLVLDPFMGSGTTAIVARAMGRNYLGCELNPEYIKICNKRLTEA